MNQMKGQTQNPIEIQQNLGQADTTVGASSQNEILSACKKLLTNDIKRKALFESIEMLVRSYSVEANLKMINQFIQHTTTPQILGVIQSNNVASVSIVIMRLLEIQSVIDNQTSTSVLLKYLSILFAKSARSKQLKWQFREIVADMSTKNLSTLCGQLKANKVHPKVLLIALTPLSTSLTISEIAVEVGSMTNNEKLFDYDLHHKVFRVLVKYMATLKEKSSCQELFKLLGSRCKKNPLSAQTILEQLFLEYSGPNPNPMQELIASMCHTPPNTGKPQNDEIIVFTNAYEHVSFLMEVVKSNSFVRDELLQYMANNGPKSVGKQRSVFTALTAMFILHEDVPEYDQNLAKVIDYVNNMSKFTDVAWIIFYIMSELVRRVIGGKFKCGVEGLAAAGATGDHEGKYHQLIKSCLQMVAKNSKAGDQNSVFYGAELLFSLTETPKDESSETDKQDETSSKGGRNAALKKLQDLCLDTARQWKSDTCRLTANYKGFGNLVFMLLEGKLRNDLSSFGEFYKNNRLDVSKIALQGHAGHALFQAYLTLDREEIRDLAFLSVFTTTQAPNNSVTSAVTQRPGAAAELQEDHRVSNIKLIYLLSFHKNITTLPSLKLLTELRHTAGDTPAHLDEEKLQNFVGSLRSLNVTNAALPLFSLVISGATEYLIESISHETNSNSSYNRDLNYASICRSKLLRSSRSLVLRLLSFASLGRSKTIDTQSCIRSAIEVMREHVSPLTGAVLFDGIEDNKQTTVAPLESKFEVAGEMFNLLRDMVVIHKDLSAFFANYEYVLVASDATVVAYLCSRLFELLPVLFFSPLSQCHTKDNATMFVKLISIGVYRVFSGIEVNAIRPRTYSSPVANTYSHELASLTLSVITTFLPSFLASSFPGCCSSQLLKELSSLSDVKVGCAGFLSLSSSSTISPKKLKDDNTLAYNFANTLEVFFTPSESKKGVNNRMGEDGAPSKGIKLDNITINNFTDGLSLENVIQAINVITPIFYMLNGSPAFSNDIPSFGKHGYCVLRNCLGIFADLINCPNQNKKTECSKSSPLDFIPYYTVVSYLLNRTANGDDDTECNDEKLIKMKVDESPAPTYSECLNIIIKSFGSTRFDVNKIIKVIQGLSTSESGSTRSTTSMSSYATSSLSSLMKAETSIDDKKLFVRFMEMIVKGRVEHLVSEGSEGEQAPQSVKTAFHEYPEYLGVTEVNYSPYFSFLLIEHAVDDPLVQFKAAAVRNELFYGEKSNYSHNKNAAMSVEAETKDRETKKLQVQILEKTKAPKIEEYIKTRMNETNPFSKKQRVSNESLSDSGIVTDNTKTKQNDDKEGNEAEETIGIVALAQSTSFPSYMITPDDAHIILKYLETHPYPSSVLLSYISPILGKFLPILPLAKVKVPVALTLPKVETEYLMSSNAAQIDRTYETSVVVYGHSNNYLNGDEMPFYVEMPLCELATTLFVRGIFNDFTRPISESLTQADLAIEYGVDCLSPILKRVKKESKYFKELQNSNDFRASSNDLSSTDVEKSGEGTCRDIMSTVSTVLIKGFEYLATECVSNINSTVISKTRAVSNVTVDSVSAAMTASALSSSQGMRQTTTLANKAMFMNKMPEASCGTGPCTANPMLKPRERYNFSTEEFSFLTGLIKEHKIWDEFGNIVDASAFNKLNWCQREFILLSLLNLSGDDSVCSRQPQCEAKMLTTACRQYSYAVHMAANALVSIIQLMRDDIADSQARGLSGRAEANALGDSAVWLPTQILPFVLRCLQACVKGWLMEGGSEDGTAPSNPSGLKSASGVMGSGDIQTLKEQDTSLNSLWLGASLSCANAIGSLISYIVELYRFDKSSFNKEKLKITKESVLFVLDMLVDDVQWLESTPTPKKRGADSRSTVLYDFLSSSGVLKDNTRPFIIGALLNTVGLDGIRKYGLINHMKKVIETSNMLPPHPSSLKQKDNTAAGAKELVATEKEKQEQRTKTISILLVLLRCLRMPMVPYIRHITSYLFGLFGTHNKTINRIADAIAKETTHAILGTSDVSGLSAQYAIMEIAKTIRDKLRACSEFDRRQLYTYDTKTAEEVLSKNTETIKSVLKFVNNVCAQIQHGYKHNRNWTTCSSTSSLGSMFVSQLYQQIFALVTSTDISISGLSRQVLLSLLNTVTTISSDDARAGSKVYQPETDILALKNSIRGMLLASQTIQVSPLSLGRTGNNLGTSGSASPSAEALVAFLVRLYKHNFRQTPSEVLQTIACTHLLNTIGQQLTAMAQTPDATAQDCLKLGSVGILRFLYEICLMNSHGIAELSNSGFNTGDCSNGRVPSSPISDTFRKVLQIIISKDIQGSSSEFVREQAVRFIQLYYGSGTDALHSSMSNTAPIPNPMVDALNNSDKDYCTTVSIVEEANKTPADLDQSTSSSRTLTANGYENEYSTRDTTGTQSGKGLIGSLAPNIVASQCKGKMLSLYPPESEDINSHIHIDTHFISYTASVGKGLVWSLSALRKMNRMSIESVGNSDVPFVLRQTMAVMPRKLTGVLLTAVSSIFEGLGDNIYNTAGFSGKSAENSDDLVTIATMCTSLPHEFVCTLFSELISAITYVSNGIPKMTSSAASTVNVGGGKTNDTENNKGKDGNDDVMSVSNSTTPSGYAIDIMRKTLRMMFRNFAGIVPIHLLGKLTKEQQECLKKHDQLAHSLILTCCANCICGCNEGRKAAVELIGEIIGNNTKVGMTVKSPLKNKSSNINDDPEAAAESLIASLSGGGRTRDIGKLKTSQLTDFSSSSIIKENLRLLGMHWFSLLVTSVSMAQYSTPSTYISDLYDHGKGETLTIRRFINHCAHMTANSNNDSSSSYTTMNSSINSSGVNIFKSMFSNQLEMTYPKQGTLSIIKFVEEEKIAGEKLLNSGVSTDNSNTGEEEQNTKPDECPKPKSFLNVPFITCILRGVMDKKVLPPEIQEEDKEKILEGVTGVFSGDLDNSSKGEEQNHVLLNSFFADGYLSKHSINIYVDAELNRMSTKERFIVMSAIIEQIEVLTKEYNKDPEHNIQEGVDLLHFLHALFSCIDGFNSRTPNNSQYQSELAKIIPSSLTACLLHLLKGNTCSSEGKQEGKDFQSPSVLSVKLGAAIKNTTTLTIAKMIDRNEASQGGPKAKKSTETHTSSSSANSLENEIIKIVTDDYNEGKNPDGAASPTDSQQGRVGGENNDILITLMKSNQQIFAKMIHELIGNIVNFNLHRGGSSSNNNGAVSGMTMLYKRSCKLLGHVLKACEPSALKDIVNQLVDLLVVEETTFCDPMRSGIAEKVQLFRDMFFEVLIKYNKIVNFVSSGAKKAQLSSTADPSLIYDETTTESLTSLNVRRMMTSGLKFKLTDAMREKDSEKKNALIRLHANIWLDSGKDQPDAKVASSPTVSSIKNTFAFSCFTNMEKVYVENMIIKGFKGMTSPLGSHLQNNGRINLQPTKAANTKYTTQACNLFLESVILSNIVNNIQSISRLTEQELVDVLQTQTAYQITSVVTPVSYWISSALDNIDFEKFRLFTDPEHPDSLKTIDASEGVFVSLLSIINSLIKISSGDIFKASKTGVAQSGQDSKHVGEILSTSEVSKARVLAVRLLCKLLSSICEDALSNSNVTAKTVISKTIPLFMGKMISVITTTNVNTTQSSTTQQQDSDSSGKQSEGWYNGIILLDECIRAVISILEIARQCDEKKLCNAFIPSLRSCLTSNKGLLCTISIGGATTSPLIDTEKVTGTTIRKLSSVALGLIGKFGVLSRKERQEIKPNIVANTVNICYAANDSREATVAFVLSKITDKPFVLGSPVKLKAEYDSPILERAVLTAIQECLENPDGLTTTPLETSPECLSFVEALFTFLIHYLHSKDIPANLLASNLTGHILSFTPKYITTSFIGAIFSETCVTTLAAAQLRIASRIIDAEDETQHSILNDILKETLEKKGWKNVNNPTADDISSVAITGEGDSFDYIYAWSYEIFSNIKSISYGISEVLESGGMGGDVDLIYKCLFELYNTLLIHKSHIPQIMQIFLTLLKSTNNSSKVLACESLEVIYERDPTCLEPALMVSYGVPELMIDLLRIKDNRVHNEAERALGRILRLFGEKTVADTTVQAYTNIYRRSGNKTFADILITHAKHIITRIQKGLVFE